MMTTLKPLKYRTHQTMQGAKSSHKINNLETPKPANDKSSLVVLDSRLKDVAVLLDGLKPSSQAIQIAEDRDIYTLLDQLAGENTSSHLHLVGHGSPGIVQVGSTAISKETLLLNRTTVAKWPWQKIFLWSCETGVDEDFIVLLEELSGAQVIASQSILGNGTSLILIPEDDPFEAERFCAYPHTLPLAQATILDADPTVKQSWNFSGGSYTTDPDATTTTPVTFSVIPGNYVIGFSTYTPESYTGPGDLYLDNIKITTNTGVVIFEEDFASWTAVTPNPYPITDGSTVNPRQRFQSAAHTWDTFVGITPYQGIGANGTLYEPFTLASQGVRYPFDGDADFDIPDDGTPEGYEVNIVSNISVPSGVSSLRIEFDYEYSISYYTGAESRRFLTAIDFAGTLPEDLFDFSAGGPAVISGDITGTGNEDTSLSGTLTAADLDGLTDGTYFAIEAGDAPANGTASIDAETGAWSFIPNINFNGNDSFVVTVTDDQGGATSQLITLTVNPVDDPAIISGDITGTGKEDTSINGTLTAADMDGLTDGTYFSIKAGDTPANGTASIDAETGAWSFIPKLGFNGSDSFVVTVTDDQGGATSQLITLTVLSADEPTPVPQATPLADILVGDDDNNRIRGLGGDDFIFGGLGDDFLSGNQNDDDLLGEGDNDSLFGRTGNDRLEGGDGDDTMYGARGNDRIFCGTGNNFAKGGIGNDKIFGGDGDDELLGNGGKDKIFAGLGNDIIVGGFGEDILAGGDGNDTFVYNFPNDGRDKISDFEIGTDLLDLSNLLDRLEIEPSTAFGKEVQLIQQGSKSILIVDVDGNGNKPAFGLAVLKGINASDITADSFILK